MKLKARIGWWKQLQTKTKTRKAPNNTVVESAMRFHSDERFESIDSDALTRQEIEDLKEIARKYMAKEFPARDLVSKIESIFQLYAEPQGQKIKRLEAIIDAIRAYAGPAPRRWLYKEDEDGTVNPYFIQNVSYIPKRVVIEHKEKVVYPPYTTMSIVGLDAGSHTTASYTWHIKDLSPPRTIVEHLNEEQLYLETPEFAQKYDAQIARFKDITAQTGAQFAAEGYAYWARSSRDSWYSSASSMIAMVREGYDAKVVIDHNDDDEDESASQRRNSRRRDDNESNSFWRNYDLILMGKRVVDPDDDDEEIAEDEIVELTDEQKAILARVTLPVHPYVRIFDLAKHDFMSIHVTYLKDYPWDATLIDRLILPAETKSLVKILVSGTRNNKEDIIRGKMQGKIVIATGEPGTGKTLTAEVFSETVQRPLYTIQCAQLGLDAETIEAKLAVILKRAQRWQAILLIDEADVYIRSRGEDIEQNAIVGVFLRVLEYYRGVLFMTSNRETMIDDAIMSRASAWVRYAMPSVEELRDLWRVLSTQYDVKLAQKDIDSLVEHLPKLSGRCVRNLLRLARDLSETTEERVTEKTLRHVAQFQYLPHHTDQELREAANGTHVASVSELSTRKVK